MGKTSKIGKPVLNITKNRQNTFKSADFDTFLVSHTWNYEKVTTKIFQLYQLERGNLELKKE